MNIAKAILTKESYLRNTLCNLNKEEREADQMSIEALKRERERRKYLVNSCGELLPGETKD